MSKTIDVLWTGGWDSTYRVLYAAIVEKATVYPHYIIDFERKSSLRELQAISEIKNELEKIDPEARRRVNKTLITPISEIKSNSSISNSWLRLKSQAHLGSQYDWLARYAAQEEIENLELSVHVDDKAYYFLQGKVKEVGDGYWKLSDDELGDEIIFQRFAFPLLEISKTQMRLNAAEKGFLKALEKSWFCFNPHNGRPCGLCNPCIYAVEEGMGYRLPKEATARYKARRYYTLMRRIKSAIKKLVTGQFLGTSTK